MRVLTASALRERASGHSSSSAARPASVSRTCRSREHLRRAEQQEAPPSAAVGEQLHRVEQGWLLLDLVKHHDARPVIEPPHGIGGEAQALVGIVEREVDARQVAARRQEVADDRRLARLARTRQDRDRPGGQAGPEQTEQAAGMEAHAGNIDLSLYNGYRTHDHGRSDTRMHDHKSCWEPWSRRNERRS